MAGGDLPQNPGTGLEEDYNPLANPWTQDPFFDPNLRFPGGASSAEWAQTAFLTFYTNTGGALIVPMYSKDGQSPMTFWWNGSDYQMVSGGVLQSWIDQGQSNNLFNCWHRFHTNDIPTSSSKYAFFQNYFKERGTVSPYDAFRLTTPTMVVGIRG